MLVNYLCLEFSLLVFQYPEVYSALCQYVTSGKLFAPISLFAFNLHTQKRFMCCIMPYSDPDMTWENNPHLFDDLDLAVTLWKSVRKRVICYFLYWSISYEDVVNQWMLEEEILYYCLVSIRIQIYWQYCAMYKSGRVWVRQWFHIVHC